MKIAIIDDNRVFLRQLEEMLAKLLPDASYDTYTSPKDVNFAKYDLVFLDIDFQGEGIGLQIMENIKDLPVMPEVVLMSAYTDKYIQQIFLDNLRPMAYLLKPVDKEMLRAIVEKALEVMNNYFINIKINGLMHQIPARKLIYLESEDHYVLLNLDNKNYRVRSQLSEYIPVLPDTFFQCHQSYLVNLNMVKRRRTDYFELRNGKTIPISRKYRRAAITKWNDYLARRVV